MPPPASTPDITYRILKPNALDRAADLIADVFSTDEPLAIATGQSRAELAGLLRVIGPSAIAENRTSAAWAGDRLVGIALATGFTWAPPDGAEALSPNYRPIGAMLAELEADFEARPRQDLAATMHLHMLAVDRRYRRQGIAEELVRACVATAQEHGFKRVVTDATNPASQRVFGDAGFSTRNEVRYDAFEFEGRRVFAGIPDAESMLFMSREL